MRLEGCSEVKNPRANFVIPVLFIMAAVLVWQPANAGLGLGEARVDSFLGQALQVRIGLLQPSEEALASLSVEVASPEDHARLGVPTEALALGLRVDLDRSASPPLLRLRSTRPVNDPFVQVLINARWSGGRMLREYTLFIDPPTAPVAPPVRRTAAPTAPAAAASEQAPEPPPRPAPVAPETRQPERPAETAPPDEARRAQAPPRAETVGPVRGGQTLWSIAEAWRPDGSVTMNQVMLAILERNPQAFAGNNVNRLQRGAVLVMPDLAAVQAIAPNEAVRRVREQNAAWRLERDSRVAAIPPAPETITLSVIDEVPEAAELAVDEAASAEPEVTQTEPVQPDLDQVEAEAASEPELEPSISPAARLELTAADDDLLIDAQAIAVETGRLEQRLDDLLRQARSDGLDAPEIEARADQIRQAIESGDAGGLMLANEGLALLEQQMRDARLARDRLVGEATPPEETVVEPVVPEPVQPTPEADLPAWLQPAFGVGLALLVLLLAVAVAWMVFKRRRARSAQGSEPSEDFSPVATTAPMPEPETDPTDARLAELYRFAESEDHVAFGSAFSDFRARLDTTDDPRWREAVRLARVLVPGHPLLLNDFDGDEQSSTEAWAEEDADRELTDLLAEMEHDSEPESPAETRADDVGSNLASLLDEQDDPDSGEESPDLARLANRLDPEDDGPRADEGMTIEDDEAEALFKEELPRSPSGGEERYEGPLNLDFEFSSRSPDEADQADQVDQVDQVEGEPIASESELAQDEEVEPELDLRSTLSDDEEFEAQEQWFDLDAADEELASVSSDDSGEPDDETSVLSDDDAEVKLDLARAYLSMDDKDSARALLEEIVEEGSSAHQAQARQLLDDLD